MRALLFFLLVILCLASSSSAQSIKNPYYTTPAWKLWYQDQTPVVDASLKAPGQVGKLTPTPLDQRMYPDDGSIPGQFLYYRKGDWAGRKYAGNWDDVYFSMDGAHTFLWGVYYGPSSANSVDFHDNIMMGLSPGTGSLNVTKFGANFTSQSTTRMGADIANFLNIGLGGNYTPSGIEQSFYFANALRAGPMHDSYYDDDPVFMNDKYQAYLPIYFNSTASSGSEMMGLTKMIVAGGSLPTAVKNELKRNGLYIPTILYIWKASFPVDAPYESEMKHRPMYSSTGTGYVAENHKVNLEYHYYDEHSHMNNMIAMAKGMTVAPPITLIKKVALLSGAEKYFIKTSALIHQAEGQQAQVRVSLADSFDLANRPLTIKAKLLYGNPATTIVNEGGGNYLITVPNDPNLPAGRTTVIFVANNGVYDSNPATVNIYKTSGAANKRPVFSGVEDKTILPGNTLTFNVGLSDPEGYPTYMYKRSDQPGSVSGKTYTWATNSSTPPGDYKVTLIGSDGTTGINNKVFTVSVSNTVAKAAANKTTGLVPLAVNFSSAGSTDKSGSALSYSWNFDDGSTSTAANPSHTFTTPGIYRVKLTVTGPLGSHSSFVNIETGLAPWGIDVDNGWNANGLDSAKWVVEDSSKGSVGIGSSGELLINPIADLERTAPFKVKTTTNYSLPYYIDAEVKFTQGKTGDGIDLNGTRIGWDIVGIDQPNVYPNSSAAQYIWPVTIMNLQSKELAYIGHTFESQQSGAETFKLRVHVSADPNNPGKARYHGFLTAKLGTYLIDFDNQTFTPGPIKINGMLDWMRLPKQIFSFRVWKPGASPGNLPPSAPSDLRIIP